MFQFWLAEKNIYCTQIFPTSNLPPNWSANTWATHQLTPGWPKKKAPEFTAKKTLLPHCGDGQYLPNTEIVAQYLYLFSAIYLVTQNIRYTLQLPQCSYEKILSEDPSLFCMGKRLLQSHLKKITPLWIYPPFTR